MKIIRKIIQLFKTKRANNRYNKEANNIREMLEDGDFTLTDNVFK